MQVTDNQTARKAWVIRGLCIGCAIRHHDFREKLGRDMEDSQLSGPPVSEAWIDGRCYRLLPSIGTESTTCSECNRSVPSLYTPIREHACLCMADAVAAPLARRARVPVSILDRHASSEKRHLGMAGTVLELSTYAIHRDAPDALKQLARKHWAKHRPRMYQRLMMTGFLDDFLERAVEFTRKDMSELEKKLRDQGCTDREAREKAWQALRAEWILLPSEK